ncbi:MAG: hypothetical protein A2W18_14465 [Candidatus Muproteobacteria bacterium RBG_16_60_9]|uniref:Histidine phosphatase family protein n=1 Tax=Candidatus Muproteobacteria bacterium RBG_16_60_9 TaxID=1817755 RepID=A0A1F6VGN4_9PROT|nr:MAG: hypothetical protein A2W18_14465 [Candidatus Muproteobacteria bacterium RBG_16_60_9]
MYPPSQSGTIGTAVRRQLLRAIAIAALVNVSFVSSVFSADAQSPTPTPLAQLRDGGLIIYFRHSLTTRTGQPDDDLSGCANQRNLNDAGRQLARDIGQAFALVKIPVGKVQSSPYRRCRDTASLSRFPNRSRHPASRLPRNSHVPVQHRG